MTINRAEFNCPYCNMLQGFTISESNYGNKVVNCDLEEGGCDKNFVVEIPYSQTITLKPKKIEGE